ncbi:sodium/calcium exchanger NCL2 [Capsella rubella]|uniref:sodium/calcium exchanger NCL2 n=1 Tax=Capsella rubella TaxID=81985 RepID=UPI000CD4B4E7|nr:sodium/calcium exchanger NCL2 [Capsella rubella]
MAQLVLFLTSLFLASIIGLNCRVLVPAESEKNPILMVSYGFDNQQEIISLEPPKINESLTREACVHLYGFLPCAENVIGYAFQVFSFGSLLIVGDYFLSKGRAELLDIFEVGLYGGIIFPLLKIFPIIALTLVTGLSTSPEVAQSMIVDFVGATVGSSVFALTIQWGACIIFGTTGVLDTGGDQLVQKEKNPTKSRPGLLKRLLESRVETDSRTKKGARIMLLTLIPFLIVQLSELFNSRSWRHNMVLMTLIVSSSATLLLLALLLLDTSGQKNSLDKARFELMSEVKKKLQRYSLKRILKDGKLTRESLKNLFDKFDKDNDGKMAISELNEFTLEFGKLGKLKCDMNALAKTVLKEFDKDDDGMVNEEEFAKGITKWLNERKTGLVPCAAAAVAPSLKVEEQKKSVGYTLIATVKVITGILIVVFLAKPFMMNISLLSASAGIPSFDVAFAVIPLSRNLKNALSLHFCVKKEKQEAASLTFSQIYRDVTLNNLMGMSIILAIVYAKGLTWNCSTEVLIVVFFGLIVGVPASITSTYPLWASFVAFGFYIIPFILIAHRYS